MMGLADANAIFRMNNAMKHRGPDDVGVYVDSVNRAALGHTRLSIIDLSDAGHQPMPYQNEGIWLTLSCAMSMQCRWLIL